MPTVNIWQNNMYAEHQWKSEHYRCDSFFLWCCVSTAAPHSCLRLLLKEFSYTSTRWLVWGWMQHVKQKMRMLLWCGSVVNLLCRLCKDNSPFPVVTAASDQLVDPASSASNLPHSRREAWRVWLDVSNISSKFQTFSVGPGICPSLGPATQLRDAHVKHVNTLALIFHISIVNIC